MTKIKVVKKKLNLDIRKLRSTRKKVEDSYKNYCFQEKLKQSYDKN